ncbi:carbohydrate ABC transporter permease [Gallicola sp. Sow4_E12]|uniref:carbohydrate ABC transporter permease n=1 Tax=Gallicola sp. Sow4_E12 TaxID=3438785 RepID=UPI003F936041
MKNYSKGIRTLLMTGIIVLLLFPIAVLFNTSLKTYSQITQWPPTWFEKPLLWQNYMEVLFGDKSIARPFLNSIQISLASMVVCIAIGILAAYAVSRYEFAGRRTFLKIVIITQMFTSVILVNPMYVIFRNLGLLDTKISLIISSAASSLPMTIWLLYSYFSQIPKSYEEASWIDGCNKIQAIRYIILPLAFPGIITAGLFSFIMSWGDLVYAKAFILSPKLRTISLYLTDFRELYKTSWETQMAACVIAVIPPFILFMIIQKYLVRGMVSDGVKS